MNYSNVAGFLLATTFPLQLLTGLLLCFKEEELRRCEAARRVNSKGRSEACTMEELAIEDEAINQPPQQAAAAFKVLCCMQQR